MKRENPFAHIYHACNESDSQKKYENLALFPRYMDIELTNYCNFRCLMCPTGTHTFQREAGFMSDEIYAKILEEIKEYKTPLRFIRWGEPLLHKNFLKYLKMAKEQGILCHLNTNGSLINDEMINKIIDIGLESIKFSFQGIDSEGYRNVRNIDFFDSLIEVIAKLHKARGEKKYPFIHVSTTITSESLERVEAFKEKLSGITDLVSSGRTIFEYVDQSKTKISEEEKERLKRLTAEENFEKRHPECPEVFDKLSINWDGTVTACCADFDNKMLIGDLRKDSLKNIWRCQKMENYRKILAGMHHEKLELCSYCFDYIELQKKA